MTRAKVVQARGSQGSPHRGCAGGTAEVGVRQGIPGSGQGSPWLETGAEAGVGWGVPGYSALGVPWQVVCSCSGTGLEYCRPLCHLGKMAGALVSAVQSCQVCAVLELAWWDCWGCCGLGQWRAS